MKRQLGKLLVVGALLGTSTAMAADLGAVASVAREMLSVNKDRTVSMDLKSADVRVVLQMLAEVGRINIVVADHISGSVTLKVKNVSWKTAMQMVLRAKGLDADKDGNVLYVDTAQAIEESRVERTRCRDMALRSDEFCFQK